MSEPETKPDIAFKFVGRENAPTCYANIIGVFTTQGEFVLEFGFLDGPLSQYLVQAGSREVAIPVKSRVVVSTGNIHDFMKILNSQYTAFLENSTSAMRREMESRKADKDSGKS